MRGLLEIKLDLKIEYKYRNYMNGLEDKLQELSQII